MFRLFVISMAMLSIFGCASSDGDAYVYEDPILIELASQESDKCWGKSPAKEQSSAVAAGLEPPVIYRCPPQFPDDCQGNKTAQHIVSLLYDVSEDGEPVNIRIAETTNRCFNMAAALALKKWRFEATGLKWADLQTNMTFFLHL